MSTITLPVTLANNTVANANDVMSNLNTIVSDYNGSISNVNISGSAAIADSKLAQITTASKVSGAALTSMGSLPSGAGQIPVENLTEAMPAGIILPYGAATAPSGFLLCDGTAVSRTTYATLFAVVGTTFGVGDGSSTFNVPDLRGRFPIGLATSGTGSTLGGTGGTIDHTHTGPAHTHTVTPATTAEPAGGGGASVGDNTEVTTSSSGTGASGTGNPPFQAVQYIISLGAA